MTEEKEQKERDIYMYLLEAPSQLLKADFQHPQTGLNQRVHSFSKQTHSRFMKSKILTQEEDPSYFSLNPEKNSEKAKISLLISREGAQYRRVRKMAEQSLRQESSEPAVLPVKGIKGSGIDMDLRKPMKSHIQDKSKFRRTSA
jgi:hypothetical protein